MGDRRIVLLKFPDEYGADLVVYTHWGGSEAMNDVLAIVSSSDFTSRIGDASYAARIFVDQFTMSARDEPAGFGVFPLVRGKDPTQFAENEYGNIITVDVMTGAITHG